MLRSHVAKLTLIVVISLAFPFLGTSLNYFSFAASEVTAPADVDTAAEEQVKPNQKETTKGRFDFRKTNWGMSKEQVKNSESGTLEHEHDKGLMYSDNVAGKDVRIGYIFVDDKLVRSKYVFSQKHTNHNLFLDDYNEVKAILYEKYGSPVEDSSIWINNLYKDDRQHWGLAVSMGHLRYWSKWDTPSTIIFHVLRGDNFKISLNTEYSSKELKNLEQKSKKDKTRSDF